MSDPGGYVYVTRSPSQKLMSECLPRSYEPCEIIISPSEAIELAQGIKMKGKFLKRTRGGAWWHVGPVVEFETA